MATCCESDKSSFDIQGSQSSKLPNPNIEVSRAKSADESLPLFARLRKSAPAGFLQKIASLPKVYGFTVAERLKIRNGNKAFYIPDDFGTGNSMGNRITIAAVGTFGKFLMTRLNTLKMYRMEVLYDAIEKREKGRGLLTISNHQSVVDDPLLMSAFLPPRILYRPSLMRWGLCSLDICFQTRLYAAVCKLGKTLPMKRFGGLQQKYLFDATEKLSLGEWVHIYPEGRVRQHGMGYFKQGIGKMIALSYLERGVPPIILPLYHEGVENVMPQDPETNKLKSIIPRTRQEIYAIAGDIVSVDDILSRMMPSCERAGGVSQDPPECLKMYQELADFLGTAVRLLRVELRQRVAAEDGFKLGDPYEIS